MLSRRTLRYLDISTTRHLVKNLTDTSPPAMDNFYNIRARNMFAYLLQTFDQSSECDEKYILYY